MDVLSIAFLYLLNDKPSFHSSITCLMVFTAKPQPFQEYTCILWFLGHASHLRFCDCVFMFTLEASLTKPSKVCPFCLKLCPHILVLSFPSSHRAFWGHASGLLSEFSCWVLGLRAGPFCFSPLGFQTPNWALAQCP